MAKGAERHIDQPRPDRGQCLGRQAATTECPRPVALRENIRICLPGRAECRHQRCSAQIEMRRELAVAGVEFLVAKIRQMRAGDLEHIGAVLRERARACWAGKHPRQVEHADAFESGTIAAW